MTTYHISAKHHYYNGTSNAPANGPVRDQYGDKLTFATREDASDYLADEYNATTISDGKTYLPDGRYDLAHGEYARSSYTIHKTRKVMA